MCGKCLTRATAQARTRVGEVRREPGAAPPPEGRERQGRPVTLYLTPVSGGVWPGDPPEGAGGAVALGGSRTRRYRGRRLGEITPVPGAEPFPAPGREELSLERIFKN